MRNRLAILVTLVACLVACKDHELERLADVKRDVCACKDANCADQAMSRVAKASIQATPRSRAIAREIMDCRAHLEAAERPSTDPDAEGGGDQPPVAGSAGPAPPATAP